jgi:hypothetical protein
MGIDLLTDDLSAATNDELFSSVEAFAKAQPNEGWRHDYTLEWCDSALKKVAAFANTFGGLLLVGVKKEKTDLVCELLGVESPNEYKTRIASSIAANISPTPSYDVFECCMPSIPSKRFCVVRVKAGKALHLVTKKGLDPVYVRNEDEARPADAVQLRRLIDREREMATASQRASAQAQRLSEDLPVYRGYQSTDSTTWFHSHGPHADTYLKLALVPTEIVSIEMEKSHEDRLLKIIYELYPRVHNLLARNKANHTEHRGADFYEYVWYHKDLDYEGRWRVTGDGGIGQSTQMKYQDPQKAVWSVVDLAVYVILFLRLSIRWWKEIGYFGEGHLYAQLSVRGSDLLRDDASGNFGRFFDPRYEQTSGPTRETIRPDAILLSGGAQNHAKAEIKLTYFTAIEGLARLTTSLLNLLLRSLGHAVLWQPLEESIRLLAGSAKQPWS